MSYEVTVGAGVSNLNLPGVNRLVNAGDVVRLSDEEFDDLPTSLFVTQPPASNPVLVSPTKVGEPTADTPVT